MKIKLCAFADEAAEPLDGQIEEMKKNGISLLELRSVDGRNVADIPLDQAVKIKEALDKNGVRVFSVGSPLGKIKITDDFEAHKKVLRHILELCKIFDCDKIRIFSFYCGDNAAGREEVIARLREMTAEAAAAGVRLYHENEKDIYGDVEPRVTDLKASVDGLDFIYDPANFVQSGQDIPAAMDRIVPFTGYFHIKDVIRETGELVPAGYGDCDVAGLIEAVTRLGRDAVFTIEPHLKVFAGYANFDQTEMKTKFTYQTQAESFAAACHGLKRLLTAAGYREDKTEKAWIK